MGVRFILLSITYKVLTSTCNPENFFLRVGLRHRVWILGPKNPPTPPP